MAGDLRDTFNPEQKACAIRFQEAYSIKKKKNRNTLAHAQRKLEANAPEYLHKTKVLKTKIC